jgi:hypothetical protein
MQDTDRDRHITYISAHTVELRSAGVASEDEWSLTSWVQRKKPQIGFKSGVTRAAGYCRLQADGHRFPLIFSA